MRVKHYKIKSRSEPGAYRTLTVDGDGVRCDCPAGKDRDCYHIRAYKRWRGYVQSSPDQCFYSGTRTWLEEHHIYRAALRPVSITVFLAHWVHERATYDKEFEEHIADLFLNEERMTDIKFKATIKEISMKNLVSGDKGFRLFVDAQPSDDVGKLNKLPAENLVKISYPNPTVKVELWATVMGSRNMKSQGNIVRVMMEVSPKEEKALVLLSLLPPEAEVIVEYRQT